MAKENPYQGKPGEVYQDTGNFLILKIMDIAIFVAKFPNFSKELNVSAKSVLHIKHPQITEIGTGNICVGKGKQGI